MEELKKQMKKCILEHLLNPHLRRYWAAFSVQETILMAIVQLQIQFKKSKSTTWTIKEDKKKISNHYNQNYGWKSGQNQFPNWRQDVGPSQRQP